jgi:hypothetical protein
VSTFATKKKSCITLTSGRASVFRTTHPHRRQHHRPRSDEALHHPSVGASLEHHHRRRRQRGLLGDGRARLWQAAPTSRCPLQKKTFSSSLTLCTKSWFLGAMSLKKLLQKAGNSNWNGRIGTIDLFVPTNSGQLLFKLIDFFLFFTKQGVMVEVNWTYPSPSVRVPYKRPDIFDITFMATLLSSQSLIYLSQYLSSYLLSPLVGKKSFVWVVEMASWRNDLGRDLVLFSS